MDCLHGFIKIDKCIYNENGIDYPFLIEDNALLIFPPNGEKLTLSISEGIEHLQTLKSQGPIDRAVFKLNFWDGSAGTVLVDNDYSVNNGLIVYEINYLMKCEKGKEVKTFCVESKYLNELAKKTDFINSKDFEKNFEFGEISILKNKKIKLFMRWNKTIPKGNGNIIKAYLVFKCEQELSFDEIIFLNNVCRRFFCFISYSRDAQIENSYAFAVSKMNTIFKGFVFEDNDEKLEKHILSLDNIESTLVKILEFVSKDIFYLEYFAHTSQKHIYLYSRVSCILACFERYAKVLYESEFKRSKEYVDLRNSVIKLLEEEKSKAGTKRIKGYYDELESKLAQESITYGNKVAKVINNNKEIIEHVIDKRIEGTNYKNKVNKLTTDLNNLRNDLAHANIEVRLNDSVMNEIEILEILLYIMAFRIAGINDENVIKSCMYDIFRINVMS